jgi:hypothetical protein
MNWLVLLISFALGVMMGAWLTGLLARSRPQWSDRRRLFTAASVLPVFTLLLTLAGVAWTIVSGPGPGENMQGLAVAATATVGAILALLTLVGGLVGAVLARRRS